MLDLPSTTLYTRSKCQPPARKPLSAGFHSEMRQSFFLRMRATGDDPGFFGSVGDPSMRTHLGLAILLLGLAVLVRTQAADPAGVTVKVEKDQVEFRAGNDLIARYHTGKDVAKPYLWPLNGPGGVP